MSEDAELPFFRFHDPGAAPGEPLELPDGRRAIGVAALDYFPALLHHRMNATLVFLSAAMPGRVDPAELGAVDDAIAAAYWEEHGAVLLPPRMRALIRRASDGPSGERWATRLEDARTSVMEAPSMEAAADRHAQARIAALLEGSERQLSDLQVAALEFSIDYLLLQRAIREDIETAERRRAAGEPRAVILEQMDRAAELVFERALGIIYKPHLIAEEIPAARRRDLEDYARRREPLTTTGLFARLEAEALHGL